MNDYVIYKITNKINGKSYIGKTNNFKRRMERHLKAINDDKNNSVFKKALKKYGWENFSKEIIEDGLSKEDSSLQEKYYITLYRTFINYEDCKGYNMTEGGEGGDTYSSKTKNELEEIKSKISKANQGDNNGMRKYGGLKGEKNGMYGKTHSEEHNLQISAKLKGKSRPTFSEEWCSNISKSKKGKPAPNGIKIVAIKENTDEIFIFDSLKKCVNFTNVIIEMIKKYLNTDIYYKGYKFISYDVYIVVNKPVETTEKTLNSGT